MSEEKTFIFSGKEERLDRFLTRSLVSLSRTRVQRLIDEGAVTVNAVNAPARRVLEEGDRVQVHVPTFSSLPAAAANTVPILYAVNLPALKVALSSVQEGGCTDLFGGWQAGSHALADGPAHAISRVMLLSDGCANRGLTAPDDILPHVARAADQGIATTTVGLGRGFNEELMIAMSRTGRGQQYYGQRATDLYDGFDEELQLLQALCLRRLCLELVPADGVIIQPLGVVDRAGDGRFQLPDLPWAAQAWLAVRLHIAPSTTAQSGNAPRTLLAATLRSRMFLNLNI